MLSLLYFFDSQLKHNVVIFRNPKKFKIKRACLSIINFYLFIEKENNIFIYTETTMFAISIYIDQCCVLCYSFWISRLSCHRHR
jgi:hypothetical protein